MTICGSGLMSANEKKDEKESHKMAQKGFEVLFIIIITVY
jgi:hypothetical protein